MANRSPAWRSAVIVMNPSVKHRIAIRNSAITLTVGRTYFIGILMNPNTIFGGSGFSIMYPRLTRRVIGLIMYVQ